MTASSCPRCLDPLPGDAPEGLCPSCLLGAGLQVSLLEMSVPEGGFKAPAVRVVDSAFPDFDVRRLIGRGGMGAVYEAFDLGLERTVALKVLPPELASDPEFADRFLREAKAMALLNHSNVVQIQRAGEQDEFLYLVLEYVDGPNLRQLLSQESLSVDRRLDVLHQVARALAFAHQAGVVHRDVKPENILVDADGQVKLADFGLAKLAVNNSMAMTLTKARQALGTPHYMAPEQLERPEEVEEPADVFAFGVVAYELLTGRLPLGRFPDPSKVNRRLHMRYDPIVIRCLETDHADRFANGGELLAALEAAGPTRTALSRAERHGPRDVDDPQVEAKRLRRQVASGEIEPRRLSLAAFLGDEASRLALEAHGETPPPEGDWEAALELQSTAVCLEACVAALRISRGGNWEEGRFVDPVLTRVFRVVESWCRNEESDSIEAAAALGDQVRSTANLSPRRNSAYLAAQFGCEAVLAASEGQPVNDLAARVLVSAERAVGSDLIRGSVRDELVRWLLGDGDLGPPLPSAEELSEAFDRSDRHTWHSFGKTPGAPLSTRTTTNRLGWVAFTAVCVAAFGAALGGRNEPTPPPATVGAPDRDAVPEVAAGVLPAFLKTRVAGRARVFRVDPYARNELTCGVANVSAEGYAKLRAGLSPQLEEFERQSRIRAWFHARAKLGNPDASPDALQRLYLGKLRSALIGMTIPEVEQLVGANLHYGDYLDFVAPFRGQGSCFVNKQVWTRPRVEKRILEYASSVGEGSVVPPSSMQFPETIDRLGYWDAVDVNLVWVSSTWVAARVTDRSSETVAIPSGVGTELLECTLRADARGTLAAAHFPLAEAGALLLDRETLMFRSEPDSLCRPWDE